MEPTEALDRALDQTGRIISSIGDADLGSSTPCSEFDVRALINHTVGSLTGFARMLGEGSKFDFSVYEEDYITSAGGPAAAFTAAADALRAATSAGSFEEAQISTPLIETVTHGWDLAKATSQDISFDEELSSTALALAQKYMPPDDQRPPEMMAPSVPIDEGAPTHDRLAAFMGRQV